jgi:hypothetical protein
MWIDPDRDLFVILLTNRVHAPRVRRPSKVIADIRADVADAAALAVLDFGEKALAMPASFRADRAVGWNRPARSRSVRRRSTTKSAPRASTTKKAAVKTTAKTPPKKTSTKTSSSSNN